MAKIIFLVFSLYMKINSINLFNYNSQSNKNINNVVLNKNDRQNSINNDLNTLELLGRSQVNFTGVNNDDLNEFDKAFLHDLSKELEFSKQDSHKFKKVVNQFLKNNNYASPEDFCASCDTDEKYCSFIENVASQFNLSDEKIEILDKALMNKIMMSKLSKVLEEDESLADVIMPIAAKSITNDLVCNNLMEKLNLDEKEKTNIISHLKKLDDYISPEQVAYEITEDYNLSSIDDFNYVLNTINSRDKMCMDFLKNEIVKSSENDDF